MCHREHLHQVDLLTPAEKKITEREYHAKRRRQRSMDNATRRWFPKALLPEKQYSRRRKTSSVPPLRTFLLFPLFKENAERQKVKKVNEQIHYTGQYLANKSIYSQFLKSINKKSFRQEHQTEIALYETARKILKEQSNGGKLASMKALKAEKKKLSTLKDSQYQAYQNLRGYEKELKTVCTNVDVILGNRYSRQHEPEKSRDIS